MLPRGIGRFCRCRPRCFFLTRRSAECTGIVRGCDPWGASCSSSVALLLEPIDLDRLFRYTKISRGVGQDLPALPVRSDEYPTDRFINADTRSNDLTHWTITIQSHLIIPFWYETICIEKSQDSFASGFWSLKSFLFNPSCIPMF